MPPYSTRNLRYLRLSKNQAIQLLLNLKQEHLEWFNDRIFQHILAALQPLLCNALVRDRDAKESSKVAQVFRGRRNCSCPSARLVLRHHRCGTRSPSPDFQFAYYLKPTDNQHHILVKNKNYIFPEKPTTASAAGPSKPSKSGKPTSDDDYFDDDLNEAEEPEEKPTLHVTYSGFTIHPKTLMVVAEPYDPSRPSRAPQYHGFEYEGNEDEVVGEERAVDAGVGSSRRDADTGG
ncbi:hypothetical protein BC938DRAFT_477802 [Jimgerdemannia flammicorona]|uniref:Uncharacterized protein n=1 Tax=Jimgerdemannia flammicorona TaxID=994334 RepID=A0A433QYR4_9FUNG|nr:hypothetical protein BC938DRAFT_477802 [Jimgerdemannia flammicorona]